MRETSPDPIAPDHIDSRQVARAFDQAAGGYEQFAALQQEVADRLDAHLNFTKITPHRMLDIGCGTGFLSGRLRQRFPKADLLALDVAPAMCALCQRSLGKRRLPWQPRRMVVAGDARYLPMASGSCDLVASSLTMQWLPDPVAMLREMRRVLAPDGLLLFSTFGRRTLDMLRRTLASIAPEHAGRVLPFSDVMRLGDALQRQAVQLPVTDSDLMTLTYPDITALVRELKGMGASASAIRHRQGGLGGRKLLRQLAEAYPIDSDGRIHATFEVLYGQAWHKPAEYQHGAGVIPILEE
ncbi:MAG: malonyl-ACP O-methyltransferase BioC [Mariprofundales bacterium]|nr:malonyl-ACP O-methyltransferase BioC [Mariprofundales bacterium]